MLPFVINMLAAYFHKNSIFLGSDATSTQGTKLDTQRIKPRTQ